MGAASGGPLRGISPHILYMDVQPFFPTWERRGEARGAKYFVGFLAPLPRRPDPSAHCSSAPPKVRPPRLAAPLPPPPRRLANSARTHARRAFSSTASYHGFGERCAATASTAASPGLHPPSVPYVLNACLVQNTLSQYFQASMSPDAATRKQGTPCSPAHPSDLLAPRCSHTTSKGPAVQRPRKHPH